MSLNGHSNDGAIDGASQAESDRNEIAKIILQLSDNALAALKPLVKFLYTTDRNDDSERDVIHQNGGESNPLDSGVFE